jgi:two-component system, sensor histidine kinase and response regulator
VDDAAAIDHSVLDTLLETVGGDPGFLSELLDTFFEDTPAQIDAMRRAVGNGNADELRRAAHSLKSNSASFGAQRLAALCQYLEELAKAGALEGTEARIAEAETEYEVARRALESIHADLSAR